MVWHGKQKVGVFLVFCFFQQLFFVFYYCIISTSMECEQLLVKQHMCLENAPTLLGDSTGPSEGALSQ